MPQQGMHHHPGQRRCQQGFAQTQADAAQIARGRPEHEAAADLQAVAQSKLILALVMTSFQCFRVSAIQAAA